MLQASAGTTTITNKLGTHIQGATVGGVARYVRDELEANALYLVDADQAALLVSCDLGGLEPDITNAICGEISAVTGLARSQIIVGATHTGGPSVIPSNYLKPIDTDYLARLKDQLVLLAGKTVAAAVPVELAVGHGYAAIGYQRRCCWAEGHHTMHRSGKGEHFTGLEGPSDPEHLAVFVRDQAGTLIAILHQNTAHPCTFYGADFYSADYPGEARKLLRAAIREDLPVLFFNGAFGDQGQDKQDDPRTPETASQKLIRCGATVAGETLRLLHEAAFSADGPFRSVCRDVEVGIRLPDPDRLSAARVTLARVDAGEAVRPMDIALAHGAVLLQERFGGSPRESLPVHALQLGDLGIITQPTELFCRFGLTIKARSPFPVTAVFSICDGYRGYCPTYDAVISGGYSGTPIYWTRLAPEAGYQMVDLASALLSELHG